MMSVHVFVSLQDLKLCNFRVSVVNGQTGDVHADWPRKQHKYLLKPTLWQLKYVN